MTNKNDLIFSFKDTLNIASSEMLKTSTETAIYSSRVYKEGFISNAEKCCYKEANIEVISNTSFAAAKDFCSLGKVAVLNFANPENPGGGVQNGAMAQEECLCRSSNLYPCLCDKSVFDEFYLYHRNLRSFFYSDRLIYTKGVTVFKDDSDIPQLLPENEWFHVDVITCSAPYIARRKYTNKAALKELFKSRIKNIFESALDNGVEVLILGAFGCGAFKNPPEIVAKAFHEVIEENAYQTKFKRIVFAIKSTVEDDPYIACPNLTAFEEEFYGLSAEGNKRRFSDPYPLEQAFGAIAMPSGRVLKGGQEFNPYLEWKTHNPYFGKQFSVLGDSISTLDGYNPIGYNLFYAGENCFRSGVREMKNTWWGKVIDFFGGELLVNNSWSGSRVTQLPDSDSLFPSGCSDERTGSLHIRNVVPDVIIVYLGTNDWANCVKTDLDESMHLENEYNDFFSLAYGNMIRKIHYNYPSAEIWCCTLCATFMSSDQSFNFPYIYNGSNINEYNQIIETIAKQYNCKIIDLFSYHIQYDSIDGSHPNADGMNTLATLMIRSIGASDVDPFMDCENDQHDFKWIERHADYSKKYVCKKCGKIKFEKPSCPEDKHDSQSYSQDAIKAGTIIGGKYVLLKHISKGGAFDVYLVRKVNSNIPFAAKICLKSNSDHKNDFALDIAYQEIQMLQNLRHPAIPQIRNVIENENYVCVIQDYIEGKNLNDLVHQFGPYPADHVIGWVKQICAFLAYIHSFHPPYIYRDMKPANLVLQPSGYIKVIDFGIMRTYKPGKMQDTVELGTRGYAAPEQYGTAQTDPRTDIYGLGMTMYFLLTGDDPRNPNFNGMKPIHALNPSVSKGMEYIIEKCTCIDPNQRYRSAGELLKDLENIRKLPPKKFLFNKLFT